MDVLNPVRRIPPEVLCHIFSMATTIGVRPYEITAICLSWRRVARSFARLWRQIDFKVSYTRRTSHHGSFVFYCKHLDLVTLRTSSLATYLRNADRCSLIVNISLDPSFSFDLFLYPLLILSANRIQRLRIQSQDLRILGGPAFRHIVEDFTNIETMELVLDLAFTIISPDAISFSKTLRSLVIVPYPYLSIPTIDMSWDYIERLELRGQYLGVTEMSSRSVKDVLSRTSRLLSLTLSDSWDSNGTPAGNPIQVTQVTSLPIETPFSIPQLLELVVECGTPQVFDVLDNLILPSLNRLVIPFASPEILSHIENTLRHSHCTLTPLTVHSMEVTGAGVVSFLRLCGSLCELPVLRIKLLSDAHDVLRLLFSANITFFSSLRGLVLDVSCASHEGDADFTAFFERVLEMLELRCGDRVENSQLSVEPLESFTLHAPRASTFSFNSVLEERIRVLRQSGMKLYICLYDEKDPRMLE